MATASTRPVVVDIFAGAGGLSLGFEQAGFDIVLSVEYDPTHALVHRFNFPDCGVLCRDVRTLSGKDIKQTVLAQRSASGIDVMVGGPSCQGFSAIGQRHESDERNDLLGEFVRLVCDIRPRAFVLENVPGLLEARFDDLRTGTWKRLRNAGYSLCGADSWLDAADFAVPQRRKRVVVIGVLDGPAVEPVAADIGSRPTVRDALEGLPEIEKYAALMSADAVPLSDRDKARRLAASSAYARALSGVGGPTDLSRPRQWDPSIATNSLRTAHSTETIRRFAETEPGGVEAVSRFYRLHLDRPARTLRAGTGRERGSHTSPRPIHPVLPRVITVREAARLHGYPDWFRFGATNWHGHRQIGNSVPPPLARAIAEAVRGIFPGRRTGLRRVQELGDTGWLTASPSAGAKLLGAKVAELPPPRRRPTRNPNADPRAES